ncbi:MAG: DUF4402 domain-containing protein [Pseudomonadota bacterium]|nr:DUF4402 domain-containing protein [Pseudomonadota bacterium]
MKSASASRNPRRSWLTAAALALCLGSASAAEISIVPTQDLAFGAFAAGTGSVAIQPGGARRTSGGVVGLSTDSGAVAQFSVTGDEGATYAITLPADGTVFLGNGSSNMPVNGFVSSPASGGTFLGSRVISVGATLDVAEGQPTGAYSGSFTLIVDYN